MSVWLSFKCFPWIHLDLVFQSVESAKVLGNSGELLQETVPCFHSYICLLSTNFKEKEKGKIHDISKTERKHKK